MTWAWLAALATLTAGVAAVIVADCSPRWHARLLLRQIRKDTRP